MSASAAPAAATAVGARHSPYQGLVPYTEADAEWFFGRDQWCEIIADNFRAYRITVLYGVSGVGKTSLLRAGLMRALGDEARENVAAQDAPRLLPVAYSAWSLDDPLATLREAVREAARELAPELAGDSPQGKLADLLEAWPALIGGPLLLVLDQLEELFVYHERPGDTALEELTAALRRRDPAVHFLLSIREDALARLDRFEGHVPGLGDHLLRLEHLDRDAARAAIIEPLERWNRTVAAPREDAGLEPALVEAVLDQVEAGKVSLGESAAGAVDGGEPGAGIEAPYLQLVLTRLWDEERRNGSRLLRLQTLERLGGADRIVRTHLDTALAALPAREQDLAGRTFRYLVTPSGTKIAHPIADLADYADVPPERLEPVVARLAGEVRVLRPAGDGRYEIYHDALAGPILDWHARWQERQKRRRDRRRFAIVGAIAAALAGIAVAMAILAVQARDAQHDARVRQSQALAGQALAIVDDDPQRALRSATEAGEAARTREAESALRATLASDFLRKTLRHTDVYSAVFSPDGNRVVTAGESGIAIWDTASGRNLHTLRGLTGGFSNASMSRDGRLFLASWLDGLAIWDVATGRSLAAVPDVGQVMEAAFSPDGKLVAIASIYEAGIWETAGGRLLHNLRGARNVAAFSPDGRLLVTGGDSETALIWDVAVGRRVQTLPGHTDVVDAARFSPDGTRIAIASGVFPDTRIWDIASGRSLRTLRGSGAAFSDDGRLMVTTTESASMIWDATTGRLLHTLRGRASSFSPDGKLLVTAGGDGTARVWETASGRNLRTLRGHTGAVGSAAFSRDGELVVTASADDTARIWDASNTRSLRTLDTGAAPVGTVAFSPNGKLVVTATTGLRGASRIWNAASGRSLRTFAGAIDENGAFSPDGKLLVTTRDGVARISDVAGGGVRILDNPAAHATRASFSPDGQLVATRGAGRRFSIVDATTGRRLYTRTTGFDEWIFDLRFSPDATLIVTAGRGRATRIWDSARGRALHTLRGHSGDVVAAAFNPDGTRVATSGNDGTARLWNAGSGQSLQTLRGHTGAVWSAAFSPDGTLVATTSDDGTVRTWDAATGRPLQTLRGHRGRTSRAAWSPDGKLILTTGDDGIARIWDAASGHLLGNLRGHAAAFSPDGKVILSASTDRTAGIWSCEVCGFSFDELLTRARERLDSIS